MNAKIYNKFKNLITKACDKHVKDGKKIISGRFQNNEGCCPISCVIGYPDSRDYFELMNEKLGVKVPEKQYWQFISGFDASSADPDYVGTQLFKLGQALRKKYLK